MPDSYVQDSDNLVPDKTASQYDVPRSAATMSSTGFKNPLYEGVAEQNPIFVPPDFQAAEAPNNEFQNPYESLDDYIK